MRVVSVSIVCFWLTGCGDMSAPSVVDPGFYVANATGIRNPDYSTGGMRPLDRLLVG